MRGDRSITPVEQHTFHDTSTE